MKSLKRYSKSIIILLLPVILGVFNGKCPNILSLLFYIPCDVPSGLNFTSSSGYHSHNGSVYVTASGAIYLSFDYCSEPVVAATVTGGPRLNDIKQGFWAAYNIVMGNNGTIVRSSQSDTVWGVITSPTSQNLNKVCVIPLDNFMDYLVAVGNGGTILVSRNSGLSWSQKNFPYNINLRDLECEVSHDTNNIRVVGDDLSAYYTTNGGTTWIDDSLNLGLDFSELDADMTIGGPNLNTIQFVNNNTGYIAGQSGYLFKTVNGGAFYSLRFISGLDNIVDMHFTSADSGFVISTNGKIKFTDNGGNNWFEDTQVNNLINSRQLNSISVISENYGYINGANGLLILTARDSSVIGIQQITGSIPTGFYLRQNHPNPFNPATNIRIELPKTAFVRLVVYDALGRLIETLVSKQLSFGIYSIEWDASAYPSGVYFYRLETNEFIDARKMILVK
jgi:photosystem II stability/assembly factor-like uncharacterized protein